jgi:plasmid maintenance system killer protein
MEKDLNELNDLAIELQESNSKILEKLRNLTKKNSDLERELKDLNKSKYDTDTRLRILESEMEKHDLYKIENAIRKFESQHDDRKQNWSIVINFAVQLAWISMAAWLLTKLGLQPPL